MNDPTHTRCIVIADDESGARCVLAKLLRRRGYEVLEASDGEEALSLAVSRPVDLLLCDLQMPRMRGEELGKWLDQYDPDLPVIFMTAYPGYETALSAVRSHAADYLEKPFRRLEDVVESVERALARRDAALARRSRAGEADEHDRVDEVKRRFVSGVAHELRTPLTVIRSLAAVLEQGVHGPVTNEQREILEHLNVETETLAHEIDKLLSLARIESSDFTPDLAPTPVADLIDPVERALRARAIERRIELCVEVRDAQAAVLADAQDVPRALRALGENAIKFTGEGGRVTIRAVPTDAGVVFEVEDTGIGIDPADHERIFEPYVQVESPLTRRHGGCGVGLTFASRIVEAHGSRIGIRSGIGEGSTFWFMLAHASEFSTQSCTATVARGIRDRG
jgi:signal transduction histidine kinase